MHLLLSLPCMLRHTARRLHAHERPQNDAFTELLATVKEAHSDIRALREQVKQLQTRLDSAVPTDPHTHTAPSPALPLMPLVLPPPPLLVSSYSPLPPLSRPPSLRPASFHGSFSLPLCVQHVLAAGAAQLVAIEPEAGVAPQLPVDHAYLIHYSRNVRRLSFQQAQLPHLGLNVSVVTAYDREDLNHARECTALIDPLGPPLGWSNESIADPKHATILSPTLKLYVALWDMLARGWSRAIVFEDDVEVRWKYMATAAEAVLNASKGIYKFGLQKRNPRMSVLFLGSYNPTGWDHFCCDDGRSANITKPKPPTWRTWGIMPAVAEVLSSRGAHHILQHGMPISRPIDWTLSDSKGATGNQSGHWVLKPYPFVPAARLRGESIGALLKAGEAKKPGRRGHTHG